LEWSLDWDRLGETAEIEFVGKVIDVRYPCKCVKCTKGKERLKEMGKVRDNRQLHIVIVPIDREWKLQHVFIDMSTASKKSRKGVLAHACKVLGIDASSFESFKKGIMKRVYVFKKMTVKDYLTNIAGVKLEDREVKQLNLDAQITVPVKVVPEEAFELYGFTKKHVIEKAKTYKEIWKLILKGMEDNEAYEKVLGEKAKELEKEFEEEETEETEEIEETEVEEEVEETEEEEEEELL